MTTEKAPKMTAEQKLDKALDDELKSFDVDTNFRPDMDQQKNIDFDYIMQDPKYNSRFDFRVENDDKGALQRKIAQGWKVASSTVFSEISNSNSLDFQESTKHKKNAMACVTVGTKSDGSPMKAYLMFAPKGANKQISDFYHQENAARRASIGTRAKKEADQVASQFTGGAKVGTYNPLGGDEDGFKTNRGALNQITNS